MLFFQVLLLGGYAYSHFLISSRHIKRQTKIHVAILVIAALTLPIMPDAGWKPLDGTQPTLRILSLLAANVGLPYFILSSTGPLVQAWYSRFYPGQSPYRLYALSNVGSLGALLTYPFFVEPALTTSLQGGLWSAGFGMYAVLCAGLAVVAGRYVPSNASSATAQESDDTSDDGPPSLDHRVAWLLLPAIASMMLLAITNHLCQDVAVVPFFWVAPLSLYLISFIICFDHPRWYRRTLFAAIAALATFALCLVMLGDSVDSILEKARIFPLLAKVGLDLKFEALISDIVVEAGVYLGILFLICMVCHGEMVRSFVFDFRRVGDWISAGVHAGLGRVIRPVLECSGAESILETVRGICNLFRSAPGRRTSSVCHVFQRRSNLAAQLLWNALCRRRRC
ncbi:MAG: hypothetical protein HYV60_04845 [Planctomycetia bacterium]|nr:hypothetical protein [Planctomycetia bacterium]